MFEIGAKEWPGLSKLTEEAGEVLQVVGKLMGTKGQRQHWDGTDLEHRLVEELADLEAAIAFVIVANGLLTEKYQGRVQAKFEQFKRWHLDQEER